MPKFEFSGSSDDLVTTAVNGDWDEFSGGEFTLTDGSGHGMAVYVEYCPGQGKRRLNGWMVGVAPLDEDVPIPDWPMKFSLDSNGYAALLTIEAPDGIALKNLAREEDDD